MTIMAQRTAKDDLDAEGPEVALWRAVVSQAIVDATSTVRPSKTKSKTEAVNKMRAAIREREQARAWLLKDSKDFRLVCSLALLEPDAVRKRAEELAGNGWEVRKPSRLADTLGDRQPMQDAAE